LKFIQINNRLFSKIFLIENCIINIDSIRSEIESEVDGIGKVMKFIDSKIIFHNSITFYDQGFFLCELNFQKKITLKKFIVQHGFEIKSILCGFKFNKNLIVFLFKDYNFVYLSKGFENIENRKGINFDFFMIDSDQDYFGSLVQIQREFLHSTQLHLTQFDSFILAVFFDNFINYFGIFEFDVNIRAILNLKNFLVFFILRKIFG